MSRTYVLGSMLCGLLLGGPGCAHSVSTIPTGSWTGTGTYLEYDAASTQNSLPQPRTGRGTYATSLTIQPTELHGRAALAFDIRSLRGKMMNVEGEESHVAFKLVRSGEMEDGSGLYALVDFQYNESPQGSVTEERFNEQTRFASATAMRDGSALVLRVQYIVPSNNDRSCFWDTLVFEGSGLRKTGRVLEYTQGDEEKLKYVDWAESLRPAK